MLTLSAEHLAQTDLTQAELLSLIPEERQIDLFNEWLDEDEGDTVFVSTVLAAFAHDVADVVEFGGSIIINALGGFILLISGQPDPIILKTNLAEAIHLVVLSEM